MLIVSEAKMGQQFTGGAHNKHFENRSWKLTPAFCHLSMAFLALDPRFQRHTYSDDWDSAKKLLVMDIVKVDMAVLN